MVIDDYYFSDLFYSIVFQQRFLSFEGLLMGISPYSGTIFPRQVLTLDYCLMREVLTNIIGGTLMRKLLFEVSKYNGFNLSSSYGIAADRDCSIPDSCVKGNSLSITYGHAIDVSKVQKQNGILISMFRDPMSWLISRWKHGQRFQKSNYTLTEAALAYGAKYFNFADPESVKELVDLFHRNAVGDSIESLKKPISVVFGRLSYFFQNRCVVLLYERYDDSVYHIGSLLGTENMKVLYNSKYKNMSVNSAPREGDPFASISSEEIERVKKLLRFHIKIYEAAVSEFNQQLAFASVSGTKF